MARPRGEPTIQERLKLADARKLKYIARRWKVKFRDAFNRVAGDHIDDVYRRMKAGEHIEPGEAGA